MQHLHDDRALFNRRGRFVAIAVCILALLLSLVGLGQIAWKRAHVPRTWCESYSPGYPARGCGPEDMAAWKALGVRTMPRPPSGEP